MIAHSWWDLLWVALTVAVAGFCWTSGSIFARRLFG